jgi:hypothetical protein
MARGAQMKKAYIDYVKQGLENAKREIDKSDFENALVYLDDAKYYINMLAKQEKKTNDHS